MRPIATIIGTEIFNSRGVRLVEEQPAPVSRVVGAYDPRAVHAPHPTDIEQITAHLATAIRLAQHLSAADQRRVRDFFHAAQSMLTATTYLKKGDQKSFEEALRNA